ncbi:hypothetical protein [Wolbachia endosymbiont (group A) of Cheilosia soror]|uniref:hypothetical protein n=1 Tax=Wolbachia endosymbiont (group A) of Cheilosia soror TaxID=2953995 RepID=UPI0021F860E2|nr:hypothetical protein [Wolbachia endosymbiont (group A) of Cheilosia soror]
MNEIDFININHLLNLEQEFGNGYIEFVDCFLDEDARDYYIGLNVLDESHNGIKHFVFDGNTDEDAWDYGSLKFFPEIDLKGDIEEINFLYKKI